MSVYFINPFLLAAGGDYDSIATVTVGSGGAANVQFTNIPTNYQHLEVRYIARSNRADVTDLIGVRINGATGSTDYAYHELYAAGGVGVIGIGSEAMMRPAAITGSTALASTFGAGTITVLDYNSTSKRKTIHVFGGCQINTTTGQLSLGSGMLKTTDAVTSITLLPAFSTGFLQHSSFALYGIKAP